MISSLLKKVFGSRNDRLLKQYRQEVARINALEDGMKALSDEALAGKTAEFKKRIADGASLDSILPEALPSAARPRAACWACVTSTCS
jgi:preprotein translocase subunit SecA